MSASNFYSTDYPLKTKDLLICIVITYINCDAGFVSSQQAFA